MAARSGTKQKMLYGAVELLRERGAAGVTVDAVLTRSRTPRGSVYHHFSGGRNQIIAEAVELAGNAITAIIDESVREGSVGALRRFGAFWTQILHESDYAAGCPVVSVTVGGSEDDQRLIPAVADIFRRWQDAVTRSLTAEGVEQARASRLATMAIAAIEGAVILCRAARSTAPLDDVLCELEVILANSIRPQEA
ncbi:TetR/AcrR family transcriptional regulator [Nocardia sp. NPDC058519]|uniref:TetR/AcrR family transcriptional regulator n=1 Tax=unclassified Nocardia TaxID=2637762 RepID=UPI00365AB5E4